ncbi:interferon-induced protein 44-like isoform X1 [Alosa pseudoharengus]|uniref:interferon-induced protein 44-like isoform X1 n=2 Tax=Alosa pseudoharengus TaxID=34774 RepID=UPI003F8A0020
MRVATDHPKHPQHRERAAGLLPVRLVMAEKTEGKSSPFSFAFTAPNSECNLRSSPETKPVMSGKGKTIIAPPTFTISSSQNACPSSEESPWRQVDWSAGAPVESIRSYKPAPDSVPAARVLLVGPVGVGKSSFINSIQSVFYGRVVNRTMVGTSLNSSVSFTKQLQSFQLYGSRDRDGESMALVLSDMVGLGETNGLTLHDTLAVIKGHVPEGHTFSACCPVMTDTPGYVKEPSLAEKVHCVVFVVSGLEISSYSDTMKSTLHQLREHISALGVQQVAVLTHVDKVCAKTARDISQVYNGSLLKQAVLKVGDLLGMPLSSIVPVKNYSEELELDPHTDTLLLGALDHILQSVDLYLRDHSERGSPERAVSSASASS